MPKIDTEQIERYTDIIAARCEYFNDYTLKIIGGHIREIGELSAAEQIQLKNMADISSGMKKITKRLTEITEMNIADVERIYTQTMTDGVNSYEPLFDLRGMKFVPFAQNERAKAIVTHWAAQTAKSMINLSRTKAIGFTQYDVYGNPTGHMQLADAFQTAVDDAVAAVSFGVTDFETARRETIKRLGGSGVWVNYGSGITRRLDSVVRQTVLYGSKQAATAYDEYVGEKLGCNGFEVDYHPNARPSHVFMGGRMFSYNGDVTVNGVTYPDGGEALARLDDYGCLHFKDDVILGISQPRYDKEWLAEQKARDAEFIEYNGVKKTGYEWTKAQRRIENEIRTQTGIKTMARAAGDKAFARQADEKIDFYRKKYEELCEKTGITYNSRRMRTYGVDKSATQKMEHEFERQNYLSNIKPTLPKVAKADDTILQNKLDYDIIYGDSNRQGIVPNGAELTNVHIIAGYGSSATLRECTRLSNTYQNDIDWKWDKKTGIVESVYGKYEVHWYEYNGMQYEAKLKGYKEK